MKKISKIIFAITLIFILNINAKAVTITTDNTKQGTTDTNSYLVTNNGTITINNVSTDTFKAYKIIDYYYNSTSDSLSYEFTDEFKTFLSASDNYKTLTVTEYKNLTSGNITNGSTQTTSTLDALVSSYASYIIKNNITTTYNLTTNNSNATGSFQVGSYLILPNNSSRLYSVMVGNIDLLFDSNSWNIQNAIINAKVSSGGVTKKSVGLGSSEGKNYIMLGHTYSIESTITIPEFPTNATNHYIYFYDIGSYGIDFTSQINTIEIIDGDTRLSILNVEDFDSKFAADIMKNNNKVGRVQYQPIYGDEELGGAGPNSLSIIIDTTYIDSDTIKIAYNAKLNDNANIGASGNTITTSFSIGEPYVEEDAGNAYSISDFTTTFYCYSVKINTKDKSNNTLTGAKYKIYTDPNLTSMANYSTSSSDAPLILSGFAPGTYYVKQVTAPNGASSINNETFTVNLEESQEGYLELSVTNATGLLPVTGGIGTLLFGIVGLLVIIGAIAYYKINQKKKLNSAV